MEIRQRTARKCSGKLLGETVLEDLVALNSITHCGLIFEEQPVHNHLRIFICQPPGHAAIWV